MSTQRFTDSSETASITVPRFGVQLLTAKQQELLELIGDSGILPHGKVRAPTAGVLLGKGYIMPSNGGKGISLTAEGEQIYAAIKKARPAK